MTKTTLALFAGAALLTLPASAQDAYSPAPTATPPAGATTATDATPATAPASATPATGSMPATSATPAATTTASVDVGDVVKDQAGAVVGRIETVEGAEAVLATANSKVRVPLTSFAEQNGELLFGMTAAEVDAAAKGAAAAPTG